MEYARMPKPGEIYQHFKGNLYQIITVATHTETGERMVVYQALYGDFKTYVRPLAMFIGEVDKEKYPDATQKMRFELWKREDVYEQERGQLRKENSEQRPRKLQNDLADERKNDIKIEGSNEPKEIPFATYSAKEFSEEQVNPILLKFLDAKSNDQRLEIITANRKHLNDRLINDMAVAMDCTIKEGPLDQRIQDLIISLQTMMKFEDRRLR